jgi:hypothetical protein
MATIVIGLVFFVATDPWSVLSLYVRATDVSFFLSFLSLLQSLGLFSSCALMVCLPSYVIVIFTTSLSVVLCSWRL